MLDQQGIYNFVHEYETLLLLELTIPANATGELNLKAKVEWLECDDKGCYPFDKEVSLKLKVGPGNTAAKYDPKLYGDLRPTIRASYTVKADTLTVTPPAEAKLALSKVWFPERGVLSPEGVFKQKQDATTKSFSLKDASEKLEAGPVVFVAQDASGTWYRVEALPAAGSATPAPANTTKETPKGTSAWLPWSPEAEAKALAAGQTVYIDFTAEWCATCQINKRVYKHDVVAAALADKGVVLLKADWTKKDAVIAAELTKYGRSGVPCNVFLKQGAPTALLSEVISDDEVLEALSAISAGKEYRAVNESHGYAVWLLLAFGGGALLNLMPCVFPVIGLKVLGFAREAGADRGVVVRNGLLYSLGVVLSFLALAGLILALKAGGNSVGWGFQMQSPGFVLGTCVLMVTLGLSLAGVFEIGTGLAGTAAGAEPQGGASGAFFSGVLATAVATPCTAPGLGAALGFALDKDRASGETLLFFVVIGLGMAIPYLLLSIFPKLTNLLPRPGEWMETLKQAMSFPLFAYALYLLWVLNSQVEDRGWVRDASLGLAVLAAACWIWGRWGAPHRTDRERLIGKTSAVLLYVLTLAHLYWYLP
jgi:thiol:disulfide interchange protein